MNQRWLVDPQLRAAIEQHVMVPLTAEVLPGFRASFEQMAEQALQNEPPHPNIEVSERFVPGLSGAPEVRLLVYRPKNQSLPVPVVLMIHGGGFIMGTPENVDKDAKWMVDEVGCVVVSVDYRLAPETRFPGQLEDCYAALTWIYSHAEGLGIDTNRIILFGASAGGSLAAALALLARDRKEIPILYQMLLYPALDDRTCVNPDQHPYTGEFVWNIQGNRFAWQALLGCEPGQQDISPYAAPARAEDLAGLPGAYVCVGALDLFLEENIAYVRRLTRAGVSTEFHIYPGAYHWFDFLSPRAQITHEFYEHIANALRRIFQESTRSD